MATRHITIEQPDTTATIDFLGRNGCTIKAKLEKNQTGDWEIYVIVTADDDVNTILGEILAEVPESEHR
jgi:hypothetical protein